MKAKAEKKLYLLTQNDNKGYDTYDSMIVCARKLEDAIRYHPSKYQNMLRKGDEWSDYCWANRPENVVVTFIGLARSNVKLGVVLASFNAG